MKKHTLPLKGRIEAYTRKIGTWINGGELERLTLAAGYKASNGSRRCRELTDEKILESRLNEKGHVEYRYKPQEKLVQKVDIVDGRAIISQQKIYI